MPAAGLGTRLRPHTLHRPKPLLHVGGAAMLDHVLDRLRVVDIGELVIVVGHLGDQIVEHMRARADFAPRFVAQARLSGQAHALAAARPYLDGPVLVVFPDMVFEADLAGLPDADGDGVLFARQVDDPARFGVVVTDAAGCAARLVEKPATPVSRRAVVGLYYVKDGRRLAEAIDCCLAEAPRAGGESYIADALQHMIDAGARFPVWPVSAWLDCGTAPDLLAANHALLERIPHDVPAPVASANTVIAPAHVAPDAVVAGSLLGRGVHIGPGCRVEGSVVGPAVSLVADVTVRDSRVSDSIIEAGSRVEGAAIERSLVGRSVAVRGRGGRLDLGGSVPGRNGRPDLVASPREGGARLNLGDHSEIDLG